MKKKDKIDQDVEEDYGLEDELFEDQQEHITIKDRHHHDNEADNPDYGEEEDDDNDQEEYERRSKAIRQSRAVNYAVKIIAYSIFASIFLALGIPLWAQK